MVHTVRRARAPMLGLAVASGCFSPTPIDGEDGSTGPGTGETGTSMSTDPTGPTDPTQPTTQADTSTVTDPTDTGCTDECAAEGTTCNGTALETCAPGPDGCLVLDATRCPSGCDAAACTGEPADLAISIVAAVWLQTNLQVTYVVANLGTGASADYRVDLWADRPGGFDGPPAVGDIGNAGVSKPGLAPGDATQYTDEIPQAPNGRHVAFALIDPDEAIAESDENNNVSLGFAWTNTPDEVHTSFGAPSAPLVIPDDGTPLVASLEVATAVVAPQIWFSLNATHPEVADLAIEIIAPDGSTRGLAGPLPPIPAGTNLGGTTFRDGAVTQLADAAAPFVGEYEPATAWPGAAPAANGQWTLRITDTVPGNAGRVNDWSVTIFE